MPPDATVIVDDEPKFVGAIIADDVTISDETTFNYDLGLSAGSLLDFGGGFVVDRWWEE